LQLPPGAWPTVLDCLCERFPAISREQWLDRMARGRVLDGEGQSLTAQTPHRVGLEIHYYREIADEPAIPFEESGAASRPTTPRNRRRALRPLWKNRCCTSMPICW